MLLRSPAPSCFLLHSTSPAFVTKLCFQDYTGWSFYSPSQAQSLSAPFLIRVAWATLGGCKPLCLALECLVQSHTVAQHYLWFSFKFWPHAQKSCLVLQTFLYWWSPLMTEQKPMTGLHSVSIAPFLACIDPKRTEARPKPQERQPLWKPRSTFTFSSITRLDSFALLWLAQTPKMRAPSSTAILHIWY